MTSQTQNPIQEFLHKESTGGLLLMAAALLAIIAANTPLNHGYQLLLSTPVAVQMGELIIHKPLLLWINDGLMAVFFFLVGLELKRELFEGELRSPSAVVLPAVGAVGGMLVPAFIYVAFNRHDPVALQGWAIPAATDIAFAIGILSLLGSRVPIALKIFLTSLAIFDDIGAIVIIAAFYTSQISATAIVVASCCVAALALCNALKVNAKSVYLFIGLIMWVATLKSGVHATLAGVILAFFIPLKAYNNPTESPLKSLEHDLHTAVAIFILPLFAFANAGLNLHGTGFDQLTHGVPMGIALGLLLGKQIGIFGLCFVAIKLGFAKLPSGMNWLALWGTSALCGVGFTMSLFIGSLAFEETGVNLLFDERLGILMGSLISGLIGYGLLRLALSAKNESENTTAG